MAPKASKKASTSNGTARATSVAPRTAKSSSSAAAAAAAEAAPKSNGHVEVSLPRSRKRASTIGAEGDEQVAAKRTRVGGTPGPGGARKLLLPTYTPKLGMNALPQPIPPIHLSILQAHLAGDNSAINTSGAEIPQPAANDTVIPREMFVFGNGDMGQHGLGTDAIDEIKRPRLHTWVASRNVEHKLGPAGLEMVAAGGMHTLAIDGTGRVLSWGINDNAALGRRTDRGLPDINAEVYETEPMPVEGMSPTGLGVQGGSAPQGGQEGQVDRFRATRVAAGDSVSVALSDAGEVRVWGSFRSNDGLLGFDGRVGSDQTQFLPVALPALEKHSFVQVSCGTDHVLALNTKGVVFTWGNGQQAQLGRRIIERRKINGLTPERLGLKNIVLVGSGAYHSFAVDRNGAVYGWGLNSLRQTGIETDEDTVAVPTIVTALSPSSHGGAHVVQIAAGEHHSLFLFSNGEVWGTGRCDGCELGLAEDHPAKVAVAATRAIWRERREKELVIERKKWEARMKAKKEAVDAAGANAGSMAMVISEEDMEPRLGPPPDEYVPTPVHIPFPPPAQDAPASVQTASGATRIVHLSAGTRHNLAVAADGRVFAWGYGISSQLGLGDEESAETPTLVRSKQFAGYEAVAASAGGQHSVLLAVKNPAAATA